MEEPPAATREALSADEDDHRWQRRADWTSMGAFGDIYEYIGTDGQLKTRWQLEFLTKVNLPFPLTLSWDPSRTLSQITCHRRMTRVFASVFASIQESGLNTRITSFGGCFAFRPQRTGNKLSRHSWGIAIDLNPETNLQGAVGDMDARLSEIFRRAGLRPCSQELSRFRAQIRIWVLEVIFWFSVLGSQIVGL
jgi:hypothetical protein